MTIGLHPAGPHGPKPGKPENLSIGLNIDDLKNAMKEPKRKGVTFSPRIIEDGSLRIALFNDPDKNPLYLCEFRGRGTYQ